MGEALKQILVVDDHPGILDLITLALKGRPSISCLTAGDAASGLDILSRNDVDLIISDINMPGKSGVEFIKEAEGLSNAPFLVITGEGTSVMLNAAKQLGTGIYLAKPFTKAELNKAVDDLLTGNV